jgi:sulfur-oxidizing protein SoxX
MLRSNPVVISATVCVFSLVSLGFTPFAKAVGEMPSKEVCAQRDNSTTVTGGCVATDKRKGNCMACHRFKGLKQARLQPGTIAPPLIAMKARFPDRKTLRMLIWDASKFNPHSNMPPFGRHKILSEKEIDLIVEWLYSL